MIVLPENRVGKYKIMKVKLEWIFRENERKEERKRKTEKMKGIRMTVTPKGTGNIYDMLVILYFIFQLLQTGKKRKPRVCVVP